MPLDVVLYTGCIKSLQTKVRWKYKNRSCNDFLLLQCQEQQISAGLVHCYFSLNILYQYRDVLISFLQIFPRILECPRFFEGYNISRRTSDNLIFGFKCHVNPQGVKPLSNYAISNKIGLIFHLLWSHI